MNIPMFNQSGAEFISKKTNLVGLAMIGCGVYSMYAGKLSESTGIMLVSNGLGLLGLRDAVTKIPQ